MKRTYEQLQADLALEERLHIESIGACQRLVEEVHELRAENEALKRKLSNLDYMQTEIKFMSMVQPRY